MTKYLARVWNHVPAEVEGIRPVPLEQAHTLGLLDHISSQSFRTFPLPHLSPQQPVTPASTQLESALFSPRSTWTRSLHVHVHVHEAATGWILGLATRANLCLWNSGIS